MTHDSVGDAPASTLTFDVTTADVAQALGSGDVSVLATPRLLAWCEAATVREAERSGVLPAGATSVGSRIELDHLLPTPIGGRIRVKAWLAEIQDKILVFEVSATDQGDRLIASGVLRRAIVDRDRFLARVPSAER
jgi:predicted thioesterase